MGMETVGCFCTTGAGCAMATSACATGWSSWAAVMVCGVVVVVGVCATDEVAARGGFVNEDGVVIEIGVVVVGGCDGEDWTGQVEGGSAVRSTEAPPVPGAALP